MSAAEALPDGCWRCGGDYDEDATPDDVDRNDDGDPICRECALCWEPNPKTNGCDDGSDVFAMFEAAGAEFRPGLYRVLRRPYHVVAIAMSSFIDSSAVQRIADIPAGRVSAPGDYPCGMVCETCQRKHLGCVRHTPKRNRPRRAKGGGRP